MLREGPGTEEAGREESSRQSPKAQVFGEHVFQNSGQHWARTRYFTLSVFLVPVPGPLSTASTDQ